MYEISGYHVLLVGFGLTVILAYWLPRLISRNEPPASALLIGVVAPFALAALFSSILGGVEDEFHALMAEAPGTDPVQPAFCGCGRRFPRRRAAAAVSGRR